MDMYAVCSEYAFSLVFFTDSLFNSQCVLKENSWQQFVRLG